MLSDRKILGMVVLAAACVWLLFQAVTPSFLNKSALEQSLKKLVSKSGAELQFAGSELAAFPSQSLVLKDAELSVPGYGLKINASKVRIGLVFPGFWRGRAFPSLIKIERGSLTMDAAGPSPKQLEIKDLSFSLKGIGFSQTTRYELRGALEGSPDSLHIKGNARLSRAGGLNLYNANLNGTVQIKDLALKPLESYFQESAGLVESGAAKGSWKFQKKSGENYISFDGKARVENFVYKTGDSASHFQSPKIEADFLTTLLWNFTTGEWVFRKNLAQFPFGQAQVRGSYFSAEKRFKGFHLSLLDFSLDGVSLYYPPLAQAIPFNFGFSGPSRAEISFEGALDKLTLHVDWDMTSMLFSYARYFSKPKEIPANFVFDLELQGARMLSGNFALLLKGAVFKGALPKLDIVSGDGQLNIISNKFSLAGWEKMLLPFDGSLLGGEMKLLANYQGNILRKPDDVKTMLNLTLDNASVTRPDGLEIKNISMNLDFAPVSFEVKDFGLDLGKSRLAGSFTALHPLKDPEIELKLNSPSFSPLEFYALIEKAAAGQAGLKEDFLKRLNGGRGTAAFFLGSEDIKNMALNLNYKTDSWTLKNFQGQVLGGDLKIQGDYQAAARVYKVNAQVDHLDMARLGFQKPKAFVEGNLFLTFQGTGEAADAEWQKKLSGEGSFSLTAGTLSQVDLLAGMSVIPELKPLAQYASGQTRFDDLRSAFNVQDGKVLTSKVDLIGSDVNAKADGSISLTDGAFNYRLDAFLSQVLSENLLESLGIPVPPGPENKQLGPVPFLLAGDFQNLQLESDPKRVSQFQEDLQKKKSYKVFNNFLPEDFLLKRPSSS